MMSFDKNREELSFTLVSEEFKHVDIINKWASKCLNAFGFNEMLMGIRGDISYLDYMNMLGVEVNLLQEFLDKDRIGVVLTLTQDGRVIYRNTIAINKKGEIENVN